MNSNVECTFVMLKPDCVERNLVNDVLSFLLEATGATVLKHHVVQVTEATILKHYEGLIAKWDEAPDRILNEFVGKSVVAVVFEGIDAVSRVRSAIGPRNPAAAPANTVRGAFAADDYDVAMKEGRLVHNLIHASDSVEDANRESGLWFHYDDHSVKESFE